MVSLESIVLLGLFWITLAATCGYALRWGGTPERLGAIAMIAAAGASVLVKPERLAAYLGFEGGTFLIDLLLLGLLVGLALRTPRNWPIWAAGFHLAAVLTHVVVIFAPAFVPRAYALLQGFWAYPVLISLALGARGAWRRMALREQGGAEDGTGQLPLGA